MSLIPPNLDDRTWQQLVEEAREYIRVNCPEWSDLGPGDPGMTLVEVFAYLTENMVFRINRIPEKGYIEFLRLLGLKLVPPAAAYVELAFSRGEPEDHVLEIPRNTRVTTQRTADEDEPPAFITLRPAEIQAGSTAVTVPAMSCEWVAGELLGVATGEPGAAYSLRRPPVVAPTTHGDGADLVVAVEAEPGEEVDRHAAMSWEARTFRIWNEASNFSEGDAFVYVSDRMRGTITFAPALQVCDEDGLLSGDPAAIAAVPQAGREIRAWYRRGGGAGGNVGAGTLTVLKDPLPGLAVTNPEPASGGRDAESLDNALLRGPIAHRSLERAVTAVDYELLARQSSGSVNRARAFTKAEIWAHARPGTVEVVLVPSLPQDHEPQAPVTLELLAGLQVADKLDQVWRALDARRTLGTRCEVNWTRYKSVRVRARVAVRRDQPVRGVRESLIGALNRSINPVSLDQDAGGWPFGQALHISRIYETCLSEPRVSFVDRVRFLVDDAPDGAISALRRDHFQPRTYYAICDERCFRTMNDGDSWELAHAFEGENAQRLAVHAQYAGTLALSTVRQDDPGRYQVYVSRDCGETWRVVWNPGFRIRAMSWIQRDDLSVLLLATDVGLYELVPDDQANPVLIPVSPRQHAMPLYDVAVTANARGPDSVAVLAQRRGGVYLSRAEGRPGTYERIGDSGNLRVLAFQEARSRTWLWAGAQAIAEDPGTGCTSWELGVTEEVAAKPAEARDHGWDFGSCYDIAFVGNRALAASRRAGVVWLDTTDENAVWEGPHGHFGLPRDTAGQLHAVDTIAAAEGLILAGAESGVYRSHDAGGSYAYCSYREFREKVDLPGHWLFCSASHELDVVLEDDLERSEHAAQEHGA